MYVHALGMICTYVHILHYVDRVCMHADERWSSLQELSRSSGQSVEELLDDLRRFDAMRTQLSTWLAQKDKMTAVLTTTVADPNVIRNQLQQVQVCINIKF